MLTKDSLVLSPRRLLSRPLLLLSSSIQQSSFLSQSLPLFLFLNCNPGLSFHSFMRTVFTPLTNSLIFTSSRADLASVPYLGSSSPNSPHTHSLSFGPPTTSSVVIYACSSDLLSTLCSCLGQPASDLYFSHSPRLNQGAPLRRALPLPRRRTVSHPRTVLHWAPSFLLQLLGFSRAPEAAF